MIQLFRWTTTPSDKGGKGKEGLSLGGRRIDALSEQLFKLPFMLHVSRYAFNNTGECKTLHGITLGTKEVIH